MRLSIRICSLLALFLIPSFAFAQGFVQNTNTDYSIGYISNSGGFRSGFGGGYFGGGTCVGGTIVCIGETVLFIINAVLVPVLFAIAFIVFLYGIASAYIFSVGDPERVKTGHKLILWGLIGFAVMISIWGLVNIVANTFNLYGAPPPSIPLSPIRAI